MHGSRPRPAEEARRLRSALNDPQRRIVLVRGGAGAGKTELAMAALAAAAGDGALTGSGAYSAAAAKGAFGPILAAVSGVLAAALGELLEPAPVVEDLARDLGPAVQVLHRAGVQGLPPVQVELPLSATDRRGSLLLVTDAVLQLMGWLEGFGRPLVLFIDDWRRGGPEAEALLASLLEEAPRLKLLLTERDGAESSALTEGASSWTLELGVAAGPWQGAPSPALDAGALSESARRTAVALACWGGPAPRALLALATNAPLKTLDRALKDLAAVGLVELTPTTARLAAELDGAPLDGAADLARTMADRLAAVGEPDAALQALDLRLSAGLEDAEPEVWRDRFAAGAATARARLDTSGAARFGDAAWRLRERRAPDSIAADRMILREAVLAAAEAKAPLEIERRARTLFGRAGTSTDLGSDYALVIGALRSAGEADAAWRIAREGLARFGVALPDRAQPWRLIAAASTWRRSRAPRLAAGDEDQPFDGLTYLAQAAAALGHERNPAFAPLIAFLCAPHSGRSPRALAFWLSVDTFLSAVVGDFEAAARLGREALDQIGDTSPFRAATLYRARYFGEIWVKPLASLRAHGPAIHRLAVLEGDFSFAATAIRNDILIGWRTAPSLSDLRRDAAAAERELRRLGDTKIEADVALSRRVIDGLLGFEDAEPVSLDDPELGRAPLLCLEMASLQGDWRKGEAFARRFAVLRRGADSHPGGVVWRFHETLARLKTGRRARKRDLEFLRRAARLNPADHRSKVMILEAEILRAGGQADESLAAYAEAVAAAEAAASRLEAGVAAECAAAAARAAGRAELAAEYDARALRTWRAWGAAAKIPADRALEASMAKLLAAEREARARSRLLAEVSHELRTPLQGMQGLLDMAAAGDAALDTAAFRDMFASLKHVVDDLTDFGALTTGEVRMSLAPVAIVDLVRSETGAFAAVAEGAGGRMDLVLGDDIPQLIETDGARVRQVLRNLLSNACKYGGGTPVTVSFSWRRGRAILTVEDDGLGFSDADLRLIFEPFQRGAQAGEAQGLGLGLALSRRVAEQLGGALSAENRAEGGARFSFEFPAPALEGGAARAAPARPLRVLVCEDMPLVREVVSANLRRAGHEVTAVPDGLAAWQAWGAASFDVAVLDWNLPGLGGAALIERLAPRAPVLVLTASSDPAIEQQARAAGAGQVLRKPASAAQLGEAVAALGAAAVGVRHDEDNAFDERMAALQEVANSQVTIQAKALVARWEAAEPLSADEAHRLAGLAAQFGHRALAAAADAVEASLRGGGEGLETAMMRLADAAHSASEIPSTR